MSIEQLQEWKDLGWTVRQISENTGLKQDNIRGQYKYHGFPPFKAVKVSNWNLNSLYNSLDIDGQYVIGFLAADGYFDRDRSVCTWIQEGDVEILYRILEVIENYTYQILKRERSCCQPQVGINIGSVELVSFLTQVYGFTNNKSRTLPFPRHLYNPLPFLRGFMDGDGYIGHGCTFTCSSENFVSGLLDWVKFAYGYEPNVQRLGPNKDCFNVTFRKKHEAFIRDLFSYPGLWRKTLAFTQYLPN